MKYQNRLFTLLLVLLIIIFFNSQTGRSGGLSVLKGEIYKCFETDAPFYLEEYNTVLYSGKILYDYYKENNFSPVWVTDMGIKKIAGDFINILQDSRAEGLFPGEYNLSVIKYCIFQFNKQKGDYSEKINNLIHIDLLLTNAFFIYTSDIRGGRLNIAKQERVWVKEDEEIDFKKLLSSIILENDISKINNIVPGFPEYKYLKEMLIQYRKIQASGGWPVLEEEVVLKPGDSDRQVEILRERLQKEPGQLVELNEGEQQYFGRKLQRAIFNFQQRYGLVLTGKMDEDTRKALNLSSGEIVDKIIINLERLRYLTQEPEQTYIIVNIPEFRLDFVENGERKWEERVIVGTRERKTPVFSTRITGLIFNPRWYIPHLIAVKDYLPRQKKNNSYLSEKNIRVYEKKNSLFKEVDSESIDWQKLNQDNFNYYFWQDSGPENALGNVIFRSPNNHHIYIHDTPEKYLFNYKIRTNSSGCVRVQNALKMAEYLVENYTDKSKEDMERILESGREAQILLKKEIPLYFVYLTVRANEDKGIRILRDVYDKDAKLKELYFNF